MDDLQKAEFVLFQITQIDPKVTSSSTPKMMAEEYFYRKAASAFQGEVIAAPADSKEGK